MERVTHIAESGAWGIRGDIDDAILRLASYEDTGMEPEEITEFVEDVVRQFAYHTTVDGRCAYSTGGLSVLEWAWRLLGWPDPKPAPECECQVEGCHEWATGGRPTPDGYKRLCSQHYREYEEGGCQCTRK